MKKVPDKGIKVKLKEICEPISYGLGASAVEYDGIHKYIRITDIDDITGEYDNEYVSPSFFDDNYLLEENDILFARTGASVGKTYIHNSTNNVYYAGFLMRVRINNHNPFYIYQQFKTQRFKKWLSVMSIRSGQPGINSKELGNYYIHLDTHENENKIATILYALDERILTQKKIIKDLMILKKTISSRILYDKGYEYIPLRKYGTLKNGYAFKSGNYQNEGAYKIITISNVSGNRYINLESCNTIADIPDDLQAHQKLMRNDILISLTGNVGRVSICNEDGNRIYQFTKDIILSTYNIPITELNINVEEYYER